MLDDTINRDNMREHKTQPLLGNKLESIKINEYNMLRESTDPYSGTRDAQLRRLRRSNTEIGMGHESVIFESKMINVVRVMMVLMRRRRRRR
jgi:hypothetical protein